MNRNRLPLRLRRLILLALREGWRVEISPDLHLTLRKPGLPPIHTGPRANDRRPMGRPHTSKCSNENG